MPDVRPESEHVREGLARVLAAYEEMDRRFVAAGGLGHLLGLYEQIRAQLEGVSYDELDRMASEIKAVIDALLRIDYELRQIRAVKRALAAPALTTDGPG